MTRPVVGMGGKRAGASCVVLACRQRSAGGMAAGATPVL